MNYNTNKRIQAVQDKVTAEKERDNALNELEEAKIKIANLESLLQTEQIKNKGLRKRYEKECYYAITHDNKVIELNHINGMHDYVPLQEINGYDMNWIKQQMKTPLYAKFPFVELNDRILTVNEDTLKKYKGALI